MFRIGAAFTVVALLLVCPAGVALAQGPGQPARSSEGVEPGEVALRQTVVVTAAATPVDLASVTRTLTVISREEIAQMPIESVADLLRLASSIDVRARGARGMQADFSVRGAAFGQTLVLVDGVRLNDAQTGHHNGDIPVPLGAIERIEILHGAGASLFGADALGGTINVITRRDVPASASVEAGSFDLIAARAQGSVGAPSVRTTASVAADRSSGFMYERQFQTVALTSRTALGERSSASVSWTWKDFGANGFYGAAPSHESTNQTLLSASTEAGRAQAWTVRATGSYRTHGDHFLFDVRRPSLSESVHRTHAVIGTVKATHPLAGRGTVTIGGEGGGDWVRSTNLGDRDLRRMGLFGEARYAVTPRTQVDASLRVDRYSEFGTATNPGVGLTTWPSRRVRLRASAGRAFRVPTFTERYYHDPANQARADIGPERSWSGDGGVDLFLPGGLTVQATGFVRRDRDVIDWLRATPLDRWQTYNVHHADAKGLELAVRRGWGTAGAFAQAGYTRADVTVDPASTLCGAGQCLSKYVLDYAPHVLVVSGVVPLPGGIRVAPRFEYKHRQRNATVIDTAVIDLRASRRAGRYEIRVDGTNLGNEVYQEIAGVAMPGRAATVSLLVGAR